MNWNRIFLHDVRCGLLRKRFLVVVLIFLMPCFSCYMDSKAVSKIATWADYMIYCFKGIDPISPLDTIQEFILPIIWLLAIGGLLFLSFEYPLGDLTNEGQQVIVRCHSRAYWYLSKCLWNISCAIIYFGIAILTVTVFTLAAGGTFSLSNTPELTIYGTRQFVAVLLRPADVIILAVILPCLTLIALNILQMTMCFIVKPLFSFLISMSLLIVSIYIPNEYILGNGAMLIRSNKIVFEGINPVGVAMASIVVILSCVVCGLIIFSRFDIISLEE